MSLPYLPPTLTAGIAVLCGTLMDALVRYVGEGMDLVTLVFWRFAIATAIVAVPFFASGRRLPGWDATRFHAVRGLVHLLASFLFFFALGRLELTIVTVLGFTGAIWVIPTAWVMLKEKPGRVAIAAGLIGFLGVLVTFSGTDFAASSVEERLVGLAAVLAAAFFYALSLVMLRKRAAADGSFAVALYANAFPALWAAVPAFVFGAPPRMDQIPILIVLGIVGMSIWVFMTSAYARAPAQRLAPMEYTALVWSALIGWLAFNETPSTLVWAGAVLIVSACLLVVHEDRVTSPLRRAHIVHLEDEED